ncbi:hypothetical protein [Bordetella bronchiseptica]|uniref:hypothetical protein n=1 Tax=Bordetella bronchiseptica TaxID=518 RepID=UPI00124612E8|nr:hypothetical protein [Bordetella bronchiseptica]KAB1448545.1 hypothetical protein F7D00_08415 [Bordetella bronchiseptica]KAB1574867.1 hypothetical protein F7890_08415 [Bordetella bronchiseptica]
MGYTPIPQAKLDELERLLERAAYAHTKAAAQPILARLHSEAATLATQIPDPYFRGKLSKAILYAEHAAGQVKDKEQRISNMASEWYVFRTRVNDTPPTAA